jgi:DNA-binding ferritin-like protein
MLPTPPKSTVKKEGQFIAYLLTCAPQIHIYHLRAKGAGSFAAHMALGELYDALPDMVDPIAESIQGKMGLLVYDINVSYNSNYPEALSYVRDMLKYVETNRKNICQDTYVQNQIDGIVEKLYSTIYKLENLS